MNQRQCAPEEDSSQQTLYIYSILLTGLPLKVLSFRQRNRLLTSILTCIFIQSFSALSSQKDVLTIKLKSIVIMI